MRISGLLFKSAVPALFHEFSHFAGIATVSVPVAVSQPWPQPHIAWFLDLERLLPKHPLHLSSRVIGPFPRNVISECLKLKCQSLQNSFQSPLIRSSPHLSLAEPAFPRGFVLFNLLQETLDLCRDVVRPPCSKLSWICDPQRSCVHSPRYLGSFPRHHANLVEIV